jgi:hypothetical protein
VVQEATNLDKILVQVNPTVTSVVDVYTTVSYALIKNIIVTNLANSANKYFIYINRNGAATFTDASELVASEELSANSFSCIVDLNIPLLQGAKIGVKSDSADNINFIITGSERAI